jgi:hypothetical protein
MDSRLKPSCLLILTSVLFVPACSRPKSAPSPGREIPLAALHLAPDLTTKPGNIFQATFTDKVVKMEQRVFLDSIRSISSDNTTFVLNPSASTASQLKQGSILFVPGIAMRKVDVATQQDGNLVVVTEDATLPEAFKDANIHWSTPVNFVEAQREMQGALMPTAPVDALSRMLGALDGTVHADSNLSFSGEDDGWKYTVKAAPQPGKLNLDMEVSRSYNGIVVKVDGSGEVQNFENAASIVIKDSQVQSMDYENKGLNGSVNFNWEAAKDGGGVEAGEQKVKLPSSFTIPMPIGGLPFCLEVSEALLLHPAFTGGKEVARGRFHVTFDGTQGFAFKEGNTSQQGQGNAEGSIVEHFSLAPIAPVGFVAAVSMPRIELKLGTDTVFQVVKRYAPPGLADGLLSALKKTPFGNWIQQQASDKLKTTAAAYAQVIISTSTIAAGAGALVPCQRAQLITTISVGANATILGKEKGKVSKDIFRQEKYITVPPLKACET